METNTRTWMLRCVAAIVGKSGVCAPDVWNGQSVHSSLSCSRWCRFLLEIRLISVSCNRKGKTVKQEAVQRHCGCVDFPLSPVTWFGEQSLENMTAPLWRIEMLTPPPLCKLSNIPLLASLPCQTTKARLPCGTSQKRTRWKRFCVAAKCVIQSSFERSIVPLCWWENLLWTNVQKRTSDEKLWAERETGGTFSVWLFNTPLTGKAEEEICQCLFAPMVSWPTVFDEFVSDYQRIELFLCDDCGCCPGTIQVTTLQLDSQTLITQV